MQVKNLKTCHVRNPLGFHVAKPVFSWITEDTASKKQVSARIEVSADEVFSTILYDSGDRSDISGLAFTPDLELAPRTRYFWRVTVKGDAGDGATSDPAWFETAKLEEPWAAEWITPDWEDRKIHPLLRRSFELAGEVQSARAYVIGLGVYELEINGKRVGNEYLSPGCNAYDMWLQYQTYDVTDLLAYGKNAIGAFLGNGWAKGRFGFDGDADCFYTDRLSLLCELRIQMKDGSEIVIGTDQQWKAHAGPVLESSIYDGEVFDANLIQHGWSTPEYDCTSWTNVRKFEQNLGPLQARMSLPVVIKHVLKPVEIITTPAGETVLDVGQNIVGWMRFRVAAPKGTKISLYHGEILQDDNFYNENLRSAKAEYHYISDGTASVAEPHFTFYGFRYVKVEGWPGELSLEDFEACVVYSDLEETGSIETSNPLVNQLFQNALWSQRDNFLDVPTDCPQRDERMGWTGDAQVFCGTATFNMDTHAFYAKYMKDVYMEQLKGNGSVPNVVPNFLNRKTSDGQGRGAACAWADAATVIPWTVYTYYGDKTALEQQFAAMCAWVDWIGHRGVDVKTGGGWLSDFHFGDWLALDGKDPQGVMGGTETAFLAAAYYVYSADLTAKAAAVLGKPELAEKYRTISDRVKDEMREEYFTLTGRGALNTQTFYAVSLFMNIAPEQHRERVFQALKQRLDFDDMHLKTGFIGTPILCRVLSDNGASDLAYRLLLNEDLPSWLYEVKMGATTIWERWNSVNPDGKISSTGMNSLNHYSYGSIVEWMYRNMCGLRPSESMPGFKRAVIKPEPNKSFSYAKAEYLSPAGLYKSGWVITEEGKLIFSISVPFDATAELFLPDAKVEKLSCAEGLSPQQNGSCVSVILPAGDYRISYMPEKSYLPSGFDLDTPIDTLLKNARARELLQSYAPMQSIEGAMHFIGRSSLSQLRTSPLAGSALAGIDWDDLAKKLSQIKV